MSTQFGKVSKAQFEAPLWARNSHIQTIYPKFFLRTPKIPFESVRIDTPDGDFLDLGLLLPGSKQAPKTIAVLFHGLEGSQNSHYIQHLAEMLLKQNIASIVMHFRGCSGVINRRPRAYHSGETTDAQHCVKWIRQTFPEAQLLAAGFSLGGNMLLKLLGESDGLGFKAAVSVSAPIQLAASAEAINKGFAKRYQSHLLKSMRQNLQEKMTAIDMRPHLHVTAKELGNLKSFRLFDEHVTAKLHGFKDADDYYTKASAMPFLQNIRLPTLILHAKDDPFMDERVIPSTSQLSLSTAYEISQHGGHVGFMYGQPLAPKLWLPERISAFFQECL
ncbi:hydrolase [Glaciecola sp. SC05]|uniref:hydrolase n=1 Tax=Glaciecola sp. SC05 TaxID=1987355 RepID=UPI0035291BA0